MSCLLFVIGTINYFIIWSKRCSCRNWASSAAWIQAQWNCQRQGRRACTLWAL